MPKAQGSLPPLPTRASIRAALNRSLLRHLALIVLGAGILSFGIHNIHQVTGITEGGVIGGMLLVNHWFGIPSSVVTPVLDILCYALAFKFLGWAFLAWSAVATTCISLFYRLWESLPHLLPDFSAQPLVAAVLGGMFVGVGCGLIVRQGGSSGGDDALALVISKVLHIRVAKAYLATDLSVLLLSLSYIPPVRIVFSLITVTISSWIIDVIQDFTLQGLRDKVKGVGKKKAAEAESGSAAEKAVPAAPVAEAASPAPVTPIVADAAPTPPATPTAGAASGE